jgi:RNA polymerase sigma-70 factor (ECF subfamily)
MGEETSLSRIFIARLGDGRGGDLFRQVEALEPALMTLVETGRAAWPMIPLDSDVFMTHVADSVRTRPDVAKAITDLHGADLFLSCACARGIRAALAEFDRVHLSNVPAFVRRIDGSPAFADEVVQTMREMFLIPAHGGKSRIGEYSGRGALSSWVRVVALRTALRLHREQRRASSSIGLEDRSELAGTVDPELDYLKLRYRGPYEAALKAALASLPDRDALLLKLHYCDGLSIDRIGVLYGIHRSTVARWRTRVRQSVLEGTREQLRRRIPLTESEFDSIVKLIQSQLEVSIRTTLALRASGIDP